MNAVTQAEFARQINKSRPYVTKLKNQGRLVFNDKGRVLVEESKQLIAETGSPDKQAVADRHARAREEDRDDEPEMTGEAGLGYQRSRALREEYRAKSEIRAYLKEGGELLETVEVKAVVMDGDVLIRNQLESLPDVLAPQLAAETSESQIRIILIDHIDYILSQLSQSFKDLEKKAQHR